MKPFYLLPFAFLLFVACRYSSTTDGTSFLNTQKDLSAKEKHFCDDLEANEKCFTLYLRIPKPALINDVGLSMLAMASESKVLTTFIHNACQRGIAEFYLKEFKLRMITHVIRGAFVRQKSRARCVIQTLSRFEDESQPITLHPNERGMLVRLTQFDISGHSQQVNANVLKFDKQKTQAILKFRDASVGAGASLKGENPGTWQLLHKLGPDPKKIVSSFDDDLTLRFNEKVLNQNIKKLTTKPANQAAEAFQSFVGNAVKSLASSDPLGGSILLLGMGFDLYKKACLDEDGKRDPELCGYAQQSGLKTAEIAQNISLASSQEQLRSAIIHLTTELIDRIFVDGDGQKIRRVFSF